MIKVNVYGLVYVFEDDMKLIDWLDENCDNMYEEKREMEVKNESSNL